MVSVSRIGHVVLKVSDLDASEAFYQRYLGLRTTAKYPRRMVFLAADAESSHELALFASARIASLPPERDLVMHHFAWRVDSFADLQSLYDRLTADGIPIASVSDHGVALGVYFRDPDGFLLEVYHELPSSEWAVPFSLTEKGYPHQLAQ
jgi:catechol 2,3-dioxygenase